MRIAYVCADPGVPVFGSKGCSIHVQEMVRAMLDRGAEVDLFVARTGGDPPSDLRSCVVQELTIPKSFDTREREVEQVLWNQRIVRALDRAGDYDLVYERHSIWCANAMSWAKQKGIESVLEVNSPLMDEQKKHRQLVQSNLARSLTRVAMRHADVLYAVSDAIVPYCRQFLPAKDDVHVIPNGVNVHRFSPEVHKADSFPGLTIGFVGSLKPWHGLDTLVDAFSRFQLLSKIDSGGVNFRADCRLLILGDGPERPAIASKISQCGDLRDKVRLLGAVPAQDVPSWLASMDIAVAPYPQLDDFYFSPLKIFEYMAAGRTVLASATGQIRELITHGANGWLYQPGDVDHLTNALTHLVDNDSLRDHLGHQARQTALNHSWAKVLDQILVASARSQTSHSEAARFAKCD